MSLEWDVLSWKEKKALKLGVKTNNERISLQFLQNNVYSDDERARKSIQKMQKNGFIEKSGIGNKYDIIKDKIPEEELQEKKNI